MNLKQFIESLTQGDIPFPKSLNSYANHQMFVIDKKQKQLKITSVANAQELARWLPKQIYITTKRSEF